MKPKSSYSNLLLFTFLALLMGVVSQVNVGQLGEQAMDRQQASTNDFVRQAGL